MTFELELLEREGDHVAVPTDEAWISLEFLAWFVEGLANSDRDVQLTPSSPPPYLNFPGQMLRFVVDGRRDGHGGTEPEWLADRLTSSAVEFYVPAKFAWGKNEDESPEDGVAPA